MQGFDLELVGAVSDAVTIPVIASSGAGAPEHFTEVGGRLGLEKDGIKHWGAGPRTCPRLDRATCRRALRARGGQAFSGWQRGGGLS